MILAYNVELNKSILNAINVVIDEARDNINKRNAELVAGLEKSIEKSKHEVNEKNRAIAYEIQTTVEDMNEQIRNTSTLKMVLNKRKINLRVPVDDLLKPFEFDLSMWRFQHLLLQLYGGIHQALHRKTDCQAIFHNPFVPIL